MCLKSVVGFHQAVTNQWRRDLTRSLTIANKLLSLRGEMSITDESGEVYEARGEFTFFSPTWHLSSSRGQLAAVRKKIFSWSPTWLVEGELGPFRIRRNIWSWVRHYRVIGGPFDGAEIKGNLWGLKFKITHHAQEIARANGRILTLRDTHRIEIVESDPRAELFTAISMVTLHMDRQDGQSAQRHTSD